MKNKFLKGNFYTIKNVQLSPEDKNQFSVHVVLNSEHEIYAGHFPGIAVAPGVSLIGMIREILENQVQKKLFFGEAADIKFLKPILPSEENNFEIQYRIKSPADLVIEANVVIKSGRDLFVKLKCRFTVLPFRS